MHTSAIALGTRHHFTRHVSLVSDTKFLGDTQRELILNRQRDVVAAFTRFLKRADPQRVTPANQTALTMILFGMINWTFTWLRPGGTMSYAAFADEVVAVLERGLLVGLEASTGDESSGGGVGSATSSCEGTGASTSGVGRVAWWRATALRAGDAYGET